MKVLNTSLILLLFGLGFSFLLSSCSYHNTTVKLRSLFDPTWDFSESSQFSFDQNYIELKNGRVQLKALNLEDSSEKFDSGTYAGSFLNSSDSVTPLTSFSTTSTNVNNILPLRATNLVGYWRMDFGFLDSTSFANHGTITGTPTITSNSKIGAGAVLTDNISHVEMGEVTNFPTGSNARSISLWMTTENFHTVSGRCIINMTTTTGAGAGTSLSLSVEDNAISTSFVNHRTISPKGEMQTNTWYHLALVIPAGATLSTDAKLYINGIEQTMGTEAGAPIAINTATVSMRAPCTSFAGMVDEVTLWDTDLSAAEVLSLYQLQGANFVEHSAAWTPRWDKVVGYWKLDGSWQDHSGGNQHGTPQNLATFTNDSQVGELAGTFEQSTMDHIQMGDVLDIIGGGISISAWIKAESFTDNFAGILSKFSTDGNYRFILLNNGQLNFSVRSSGGAVETLLSDVGAPIPLNEWVHVMATHDDLTTGSIYINGRLSATKTDFTVARGDTTAQLRIGFNANNSAYFDGEIDDVVLWNAYLTSSDVSQIYHRQKQKYAGHYDSKVIDLGGSIAKVPDFSWVTNIPFGKELIGDIDLDGTPDRDNLVSYSQVSQTLDDGLLGYWSFNESSWAGVADEVKDISGQGRHGVRVNGADTSATSILGRSGGFVASNNDYVDFGDIDAMDGLEALTVCSWVKSTFDNSMGIVSKSDLVSTKSWLLFKKSSDTISLYVSSGTASWDASVSATTAINDGRWHHVCGTYNGAQGVIKLYMNGVEEGSVSSSVPAQLGAHAFPFLIGTWSTASTHYDGNIDEVAVWSRDLAASEVNQIYRRGANRIKFQVKSCVDSSCECKSYSVSPVGTSTDCDGDAITNVLDLDDIHKAEFIGPGGDGSTFYSELFNRKATDLTFNCGLNTSDSDGNVCVDDEIFFNSSTSAVGPLFKNSDFPLSARLNSNPYFQYRLHMEAEENSACNGQPCLPELTSVGFNSSGGNLYYGSAQEVTTLKPFVYQKLNSIDIQADDCARFQLSPNGSSYYYVIGGAWVIATLPGHRMTQFELESNLVLFSEQFGPGSLYIKTFLQTNANQTLLCGVQSIDITSSNK